METAKISVFVRFRATHRTVPVKKTNQVPSQRSSFSYRRRSLARAVGVAPSFPVQAQAGAIPLDLPHRDRQIELKW